MKIILLENLKCYIFWMCKNTVMMVNIVAYTVRQENITILTVC